ncbi:hypothetical protein MKX01_000425 [Papaver californicum]|nr:hypothetical protein MKX01_000425 [Papaver californicum]
MGKVALGCPREATQPDCLRALVAEFICTFLFVFAGVGSAYDCCFSCICIKKLIFIFGLWLIFIFVFSGKLIGDSLVGLFVVAMTHALVVGVMISVGLQTSGGHLNPAVTLGLAAGGHITNFRSILYIIDQLLASALACETPAHTLAVGVDSLQGVVWEIILTFSLQFTVYATLVDPKKGAIDGLRPILIGFVVGANIIAGGPFSGASMNPARSFGPALVSGNWTDHWVYWVGPLIGGPLAGYFYENFFIFRTTHVPTDEESS